MLISSWICDILDIIILDLLQERYSININEKKSLNDLLFVLFEHNNAGAQVATIWNRIYRLFRLILTI